MPVGIRAAQLESNRKQSAITASDSGRDIYKQLKNNSFYLRIANVCVNGLPYRFIDLRFLKSVIITRNFCIRHVPKNNAGITSRKRYQNLRSFESNMNALDSSSMISS